ncbi:VanZ family protein [Halalkalibacter krulwichiae]|uniref:VanZ like family protein n=1 Tax=Halalkalibacter krulwichiae TaxID=199441 RepID=A0A1X9MEX9_9BACI|nr:VanZ family protein [Halalkalibacter krulwichiae]ARK32005.1 VanZ like family protein [Halalkalibacter krulwichiae]
MKKWTKLIVLYWLPVFFVAAVIFTASSQPYEQQDIRPYLSQVTDIDKIKEMYQQLRLEHVQHRLYVEENGFKQTLTIIVEKWKWLVGLALVLMVICVGFVSLLSFYYIRKKGYKRFFKVLAVMTVLFVVSTTLMFTGILFAFRLEEGLLFLKERLMGERVREVVSGIEFTYAGNIVSVERSGLEGFIEFLLRKAAHFSLFFVLGFLMYRALIACGFRRATSYIGSLIFVLMYAISDEVHQAFTPNRSPLVEDVLLDFSGGLTGVTLAFVLFFKTKKNKRRKVERVNRRYVG